ncbi:MAG: N-acetylmuramoyl-L-alanine amidase [Bacteroidetes bacterium]|nr:N-acetylmuramoyl-L-alanine amidase [Bacteroidota bacterium]
MKNLLVFTSFISLVCFLFLVITPIQANSQIIVIDAGHGYEPDGSNGDGRTTTEINTNWSVSVKLRDLIQNNTSWTVHLTRPNNGSGSQVSVNDRALMSNNWDADMFLSIHCNAGGGTGTETFYCSNNDPSSAPDISFATEVQTKMVQYGVWINRRVVEDNSYLGIHLGVLNYSTATACLNEIGFVDFVSDAAKLLDNIWRDKFANGYFVALQNQVGNSGETLTITSPNNGEDWQTGTTHNITWTSSSGVTGTVQIQPYLNGSPQTNIAASAPNTGSYSWTIPTNYPSGTTYQMSISAMNGKVWDFSDKNFTISLPTLIITSPNGEENWQTGTTHNITWNSSSGVTGTVQIQPYLNSSPQTNIAASAPNTGSYSWTIPSNYPPGTTYQMSISAMNGKVWDLSDHNYIISSLSALTVSPTNLTIESNTGSSGQINVTSNVNWYTNDDVSWLSVSPSSGSNKGTVTVTATSENTSTTARSGTVSISASGIAKTVSVSQKGTTTTCYSLATSIYPSGTGNISINTSHNCSGGYSPGTLISLTAIENSGNTFIGWTGSGGVFSNQSSSNTLFTISGNANITANFTQQPTSIITLAKGLNRPLNLTVDAAFVYWVENDVSSGAVKKVSINGGNVTTLANDLIEPTAIVVDDSFIYWIERNNGSNGSLKKVAINGGSITTLATGLNNAQNQMTQDASYIYFGDGLTGGGGAIRKVPKGGGSVITLVSTGIINLRTAIAVDPSNVYFTDDQNNIKMVPVNGGSVTTIGSGNPVAMILYANDLYWVEYANGTVKKMSKNGGSITTLASGSNSPGGITTDGSSVYWIEYTNPGKVWKVSVNGGSSTIISNEANTIGIAADKQSPYWAVSQSLNQGKIQKLGILQTFTISGNLRTSGGIGISGGVMNGLPGNPSTDGNGFYLGTVEYGWSGIVTPTKSGYTFGPENQIYSNVSSNLSTDYVGTNPTSVYQFSQIIPAHYALSQNYPNPFNPSTIISYDLPNDGNISIRVYDLFGKEVGILVSGFKNAGRYTVEFNGSNLSSGVYFYRLTTENYTEAMKLILMK